MANTRRRNGFSAPFPMLQICTWIYLPTLMLEWLFFVAPILPLAASIVCSLIFFAFALGVAYFTYLACITDPIDVYLQKHVQTAHQSSSSSDDDDVSSPTTTCCYRGPNISNVSLPIDDESLIKYCWVCETNVAHHSMHCKYCNKCVSHFDHHCLWLNTCVGEANYPYFYKILWSTCGMLVVHTFCMIGLVIDVFVGGSSQERANAWFDANQAYVVAGVNVFFILSNMVSLSAVAQLLNFHIGLRRKKLTTYQYIITDNARRREATQRKEQRQVKRTTAVTKARQEGKPILALRLELGQYCCTPCDALPPDEEVGAAAVVNGGDDQPQQQQQQQQASGYAALPDDGEDSDAVFSEETSERDLARTANSTSLGASSSSKLEQEKQEENGIMTAGESMSSETDLPRSNGASLDVKSSSSSLQMEKETADESTLDDSSPPQDKEVNGGVNGNASGDATLGTSNGSSNEGEAISSESSESRTENVERNGEEQGKDEKDSSAVENT